jgi:glycosyltransferase involved in cell wall biosynthesis
MNQRGPNISIICPVRNEEKFILMCLNSIKDQENVNGNAEVLVVDGMSTDNTRSIVKDFCKREKNFQLVDNPNFTAPFALNTGLKKSKGNIIIRVDGHAKLTSNYVSQCVHKLENTDYDCIGGMIKSVNETTTGKAIAAAMSSPFGVGNARFRTSGKEGLVDTVAFGAYRRNIFEQIGFFDTELTRCQDDEFNYRLRKNGGKIFFTPKIKAEYYPRSSFLKLWKQYFGYGTFKVRVFQKNTTMMQPRQFIPSLFVCSLLLTFILGFFVPFSQLIFSAIIIGYLSSTVLAAVIVSAQKKQSSLVLKTIFSFLVLHVSYGFGFIWGNLKFAKRWFNKKNEQTN